MLRECEEGVKGCFGGVSAVLGEGWTLGVVAAGQDSGWKLRGGGAGFPVAEAETGRRPLVAAVSSGSGASLQVTPA